MQKKHMRAHKIIKAHMTVTQKPKSILKPNNWLMDIIQKVNSNAVEQQQITTRARNDSLCILCKGARALCGKTRCPIMVKVNYFLKSVPLMATEELVTPTFMLDHWCRQSTKILGFMTYLSDGLESRWMRS
jgi:hypothetical protein